MKLSICEPSLFFQYIFDSFSDERKKVLTYTFLSAIIIGYATHLFMFVNKLPNHDDVGLFYYYIDWTYQGRWFAFFSSWLSGRYSTPMTIGTISIFCLAVSSCFVVLSLDIKKVYCAVFVSAFMMTMPSVAWTFGYMHGADAFFISLTLACIAVFVTNRYIYGFLGGAVLFGLSLGIYQLYFCFAFGLFTLVLIFTLFDKAWTLQYTLIYICKATLSILLGILIYYAALKIMLDFKNITMTTYKGFDRIGYTLILQIFENLPSLIKGSLIEVKEYFFNWRNFLANRIILTISIVILLHLILTKKIYLNLFKTIVLLLCLAFFPIMANILHILSSGESMYLLTSYPLIVFYLFTIKLLDINSFQIEQKLLFKNLKCTFNWIVVIFLLLVIRSNYIFTNEAYIKMHLGYEQIYSFTTRLITHIELLTDFEKNPKVILIQNTPNIIIEHGSVFCIDGGKPGLLQGGLIDGQSMLDSYTYHVFINHYLASKIEVVNLSPYQSPDKVDLYKKYSALPEVASMPNYPSKGSIKIIDGNIIVKLN